MIEFGDISIVLIAGLYVIEIRNAYIIGFLKAKVNGEMKP
tara:strand:- start:688 stop:807 length:120 start_codon:yes stop_codon:yes gene_type:complete